jgi:hypothetical protein
MCKSIKKRMNYNQEAIKALSDEFGVSTTFVRQSIRKDKHSLTAQTIEKKYKELVSATLKAVADFKANPTK